MYKITDLRTGRERDASLPFVAALGDFDGVHLGHRKVIEETIAASCALGTESAAWFFSDGAKRVPVLTDEKEKMRLFAELGLGESISESFDDVKDMTPEEFVADYLIPLGCRGVVCGFNFRFGSGASGDVELLGKLCGREGLYFKAVDAVELDGETVSSTAIRALLSEGDAERASAMLARPYSVRAEVAHGRTLGKKLGFPTINQNFAPGAAVPRHGVYFTYTMADGVYMPSVSNVGSRPTVGGHVCRLETHILDCADDLYGKEVEVFFIKFRRSEETFSGEDELARAIASDVEAARRYFGGYTDAEGGVVN